MGIQEIVQFKMSKTVIDLFCDGYIGSKLNYDHTYLFKKISV